MIFKRIIVKMKQTFGPYVPNSMKAQLGAVIHPRIAKSALLDNRERITLAPNVFVDHFSILRPAEGSIVIADNSYIGPYCVILASGGVTIGQYVMVGPHTVIASGNHDFKQTDVPMKVRPMVAAGPIVVEDDVWIGSHCLILDNVTVAKGCVIAGGAVLNRSTEPYGIYAGVPAKKIGSRLASEKLPEIIGVRAASVNLD